MSPASANSSTAPRFPWRSSPENPGYFVRLGHGVEKLGDFSHRYNHGEHYIFLGANLTLSNPIPISPFLNLARDAWTALRFTTPLIAMHTEQDTQDNTLITYQTARNAKDARAWAERTVRFNGEHTDLDELRYEVGKKPIPEENGDQTFLYFISRSSTSIGVLMYTSHVPFDGAGTKIVLTRYLKQLAEYLGDPSKVIIDKLEWGTEGENLIPGTLDVLGPSEVAEGPEYDDILKSVMRELFVAVPHAYGFRQRYIGPGPSRRLSHTFAAEETAVIIQRNRSRGFTVNQLVHAAVMLTCICDNPPDASTSPDASLLFYGIVDCRHRLAIGYSGRNGYPGSSLGMSPIVVPVSLFYANAKKGMREQLFELTAIVKEIYLKQKALPSLLAINGDVADFIVADGKANVPLPWMCPYFIGDGIGENYLDPVYDDAYGSRQIRINDYFTSVNRTDPGPCFRVFSWGKRLTLTIDYNEYAMPSKDVQIWMNQWISLIRLII